MTEAALGQFQPLRVVIDCGEIHGHQYFVRGNIEECIGFCRIRSFLLCQH